MNARLRKDLKVFLDRYIKFELIQTKYPNLINLEGEIDIVDENGLHWKTYKISISFIENEYPNVIPTVIELSNYISRSWDFHISKKGECCLDISHKLIKQKNIGIDLTNFYKNVIYPFFANHQYMLKTGNYANGDYRHFNDGIIQFYNEELKLFDSRIIIKILELALGKIKADANKECPVCGKLKYKKCCRTNVYKLISIGKEQLEIDLKIFEDKLDI